MSAAGRTLLRASVRPAPGRPCSSKGPNTGPKTGPNTGPSAGPNMGPNMGPNTGPGRTEKQEKRAKTSIQRPAPSASHDWIGPPNPLSNLRPVIYRVPETETELETRLRTLRQETEDWNHHFWTKQNMTFSKEKESFIKSQLNAKGLSRRDEQGRRRSLDSEEMATFYKNFLDKNRTRHADYNKEWYRRNFTITFLMARVALQNVWKNLSPNGKKNDPT